MVEELLVSLLLDEQIIGAIDQIKQVLVINNQKNQGWTSIERARVANTWIEQLSRAHKAILHKQAHL